MKDVSNEHNLEEFKNFLINEERSQNTIDSYICSINLFFVKYDELNKKNMIEFKKWQLGKWKPKTVHNRLVAMNQFCRFLKHPEYCVKSIKIQQMSSVENVITLDEYKKLLDGLKKDKNERGFWMITYLAKTGARVSEFIKISKKALDTGYEELWTKGKIRRIYIPKDLIEQSKSSFDKNKSEFLFENKNGNSLTSRGVSSLIKSWANKYGIRPEVAHPHSFRHLYAIEFLKRNPNISLLADLMGHSNVSTTSIYLKLSREEQIKQFNEASNW